MEQVAPNSLCSQDISQNHCNPFALPGIYPGTYPLNLGTVLTSSPLNTIVTGTLQGQECAEKKLKGEGREQRTKPERGGSQARVSQALAERGQH